MLGGVEQLGFLIRRNLGPIQGRVHRDLIEPELQAVRTRGISVILCLKSLRWLFDMASHPCCA